MAELAQPPQRFREIARVAGLIFQGYPGVNKSVKQLQASSELLYDVFARYDPDNLLLFQAHREVLERQLEQSRLTRALERMGKAEEAKVELARLVKLGGKVRNLKNHGLEEGVSTRLLIYAAQMIAKGIDATAAAEVAICSPITDDRELQRSIREIVTTII